MGHKHHCISPSVSGIREHTAAYRESPAYRSFLEPRQSEAGSSASSSSPDEHHSTPTDAPRRPQFHNAFGTQRPRPIPAPNLPQPGFRRRSFSAGQAESPLLAPLGFGRIPTPSFSPLTDHGASGESISGRGTSGTPLSPDHSADDTRNTIRATSGTSAEEAVYHQPIGSQPPPVPNTSDMAMNQEQMQRMIDAAIDSYIQRHPPAPGPPGPPGPQGPAGLDGTNGGNPSTPRWNAADVGFFDPMYDDKSVHTGGPIAHTGKDTYFRDVHYFIRRANDIATVKGAEIVRQNLWTCLRGTALEWWTGELTENEKLLTTLTAGADDKLRQWTRLLHARFKASSNIALESLLNERYTLKDAANRREPREYAQKILRLAMDASLDSVKNQLDTIYNGIDSSLRKGDIKRPKEGATISGMLEDLDDCKQDWWDYGAKAMRMQGRSQQQPPRSTQGGQYDSNSSASVRGGNQPNSQRRPPPNNQYRPNAYSSNQYQGGYQSRNFPSYQSGYPSNGYGYQNRYGQYGQAPNQGQSQFSNVGALPPPPGRLQITAGSGTATNSTSTPPNASNSSNQRQPFRPRPNPGGGYQKSE